VALPEIPAESTLIDYGLEVLAERDVIVGEHVRLADERHAELVEVYARLQKAEDEARRVTESLSWRALERVRRIVPADSAVGRRVRAVTARLFARGSRRSAGPRG
jgi:hypothetical protein